MSEVNQPVVRRKRVDRIKRYMIITFLIFLITPSIICGLTLKRIQQIDGQVKGLEGKLAVLEEKFALMEEKQAELEKGQKAISVAKVEEPEEETEAIPENYRQVYLTFDDGPSTNTEKILDILDKYGVKATFFVTGAQAEKHPEWYKLIVDRGHSIGMHSFTHKYSEVYASEDAFIEDLSMIHDFIQETTGTDTHLYRFPGGSSNHTSKVPMETYCSLINKAGYTYFDWNISSQDATSPAPAANQITSNVTSQISKYKRCIILMHDAAEKGSTVEALPDIIENVLALDKTVILPIDENTEAVQHLMVVGEGGTE